MNTVTGQFLQPSIEPWLPWLYTNSYVWTLIGFGGNLLFSSRFFLQWMASEKRQKLVVPAYFWHLSFWGSVINLIYAFHIDNAPIIFGVFFLPIIYGRNLVLLRKTRSARPERETSGSLEPALRPA